MWQVVLSADMQQCWHANHARLVRQQGQSRQGTAPGCKATRMLASRTGHVSPLQLLLPVLGHAAMVLALFIKTRYACCQPHHKLCMLANSYAFCLTPAPRLQHMLNSAYCLRHQLLGCCTTRCLLPDTSSWLLHMLQLARWHCASVAAARRICCCGWQCVVRQQPVQSKTGSAAEGQSQGATQSVNACPQVLKQQHSNTGLSALGPCTALCVQHVEPPS